MINIDDNNLHGHDHGHSVHDKRKSRINNSELGHKLRYSAQVKRKAISDTITIVK